MPSSYIVVPLAFQLIAIIFSPIGLGISNACNVNPFNNPNCVLQFNNPQAIAFTTNGYSLQVAQAQQACNSLAITNPINGQKVTVAQSPFSFLTKLPLLSNIFDYIVGILQPNVNAGGITGPFGTTILNGNPNAPPTIGQQCLLASTSLLTISYDGNDIFFLFISAVLTAGALAALSSVVLNAGGALIIFTISSLSIIYLILNAYAYPTWVTIPAPFGAFLYGILTLSFAIGMISEVGSLTSG